MLANVNKDHITSETLHIVSDSNVSDSAVGPHFRYYVISDANLDQLRCSPVFRDLGTEEKRGFYFLTLREFPDTPGTHIYV